MKKLISINPANQSIVGEVLVSSSDEIHKKVLAARNATKSWKDLGIDKRIALLAPLVEAFQLRINDLIELSILEIGKTRFEAVSDIPTEFDYFNEFITNGPSYIKDEITVNNEKIQHRIIYEPRGVVGCIAPWNFPLTNFIWAVIPNLIVGNTVIFKHSEECPLIGKLIEEVMTKASLPYGVFSEIYGDGSVGEMLVESDIDMVWFTGSSSSGKRISEIAGKKQIKAILEMGGSNPAIIFEDADIINIIPKILSNRLFNCGQVCDAIKRLIVHKNIYDKAVKIIIAHVRNIKVGNPQAIETQLGPLAAMRQLELLEFQVKDAITKGAVVEIGGARPAGLTGLNGAYYSPTILTNIKRDMRVWNEEVFGPVLPIISFETEEEAITLANDTMYGLGAVVHSANFERARRVAMQIDAGSVDINAGNHWQQCNPFGGFKSSGMGCEHGRLGFQELCRFKVVAEG